MIMLFCFSNLQITHVPSRAEAVPTFSESAHVLRPLQSQQKHRERQLSSLSMAWTFPADLMSNSNSQRGLSFQPSSPLAVQPVLPKDQPEDSKRLQAT